MTDLFLYGLPQITSNTPVSISFERDYLNWGVSTKT